MKEENITPCQCTKTKFMKRALQSNECIYLLLMIGCNKSWHFTTLQFGDFNIQRKQIDSSHFKKTCLMKDAHSSRCKKPPGSEAVRRAFCIHCSHMLSEMVHCYLEIQFSSTPSLLPLPRNVWYDPYHQKIHKLYNL